MGERVQTYHMINLTHFNLPLITTILTDNVLSKPSNKSHHLLYFLCNLPITFQSCICLTTLVFLFFQHDGATYIHNYLCTPSYIPTHDISCTITCLTLTYEEKYWKPIHISLRIPGDVWHIKISVAWKQFDQCWAVTIPSGAPWLYPLIQTHVLELGIQSRLQVLKVAC